MRRRWTPREIATMTARYPREGPKRLAQELGRSVDAISSQARRYGQNTKRRSYQITHSDITYEELIGATVER